MDKRLVLMKRSSGIMQNNSKSRPIGIGTMILPEFTTLNMRMRKTTSFNTRMKIYVVRQMLKDYRKSIINRKCMKLLIQT